MNRTRSTTLFGATDMAKHVIKKDQMTTVEVTEGNSQWIVETGVTLSGAPALLNEGFDDVSFVIGGKLVTTGDGIVSYEKADDKLAVNTSVIVGVNGSVTAGDEGILMGGDSASVKNRGLVQAEGTAIGGFGADLTIENSGEVISESNAAIGIVGGDNFSIRNDGLLRGAEMNAAITIMGGYGTLVNGKEGIIDGYVFFSSALGDTSVTNRGTIAGDTTAVVLGTGADYLVNRGEIFGGISLGAGDDVADLCKGILTNSVVEGGDGDDLFIIDRSDIQIVELSGGGGDFIRTTVSYALGNLDTDDIETLSATGRKDIDLGGNDLSNTVIGNVGDNAISGGGGVDHLSGLEGRDLLTGGTGNDFFQFAKKCGVDTITDFSLSEDDIYLTHIAGIDDFGDVQSRMSSVDFDKDGDLDTVINLGGGNRIRLTDIAQDDLQFNDFAVLT